jgi:hypothetical protein
MPSEKKTLNAKELAKILGISLHLAYDLMRRDGFPTIHVGKRLLVNTKLLEVWLDKNCNFEEGN